MTRIRTLLTAFGRNTTGATAIEYGMVAMFIALAIMTVVQALGVDVLNELYDKIADATKSAAGVGP